MPSPRRPWAFAWALIVALCAPAAVRTGHASGITQAQLEARWAERMALEAAQDLPGSDAALAELVRQVTASGWEGAWAVAERLAQEAVTHAEPHRAYGLAQAAAALGPQRPAAAWALARSGLRVGAYGPALGAGVRALAPWSQPGPDGAAARARLGMAAVWSSAWALALMVTVAQMTTAPLWRHDVAHRLTKKPAPSALVGVALMLGIWAGVWAAGLGVVIASVLLLAPTAPYLDAAMRRGAAFSLAVAAVALLALPQVAVPLQHFASPAGARDVGVRDLTATWARQRLPAPDAAGPRDLWAWALIARREGDAATALALGRRAQAQGVQSAVLTCMLGNLLWEAHDFEAARDAYLQALAQDPHYAIARFNLSQALLSLARPLDAEAARSQAFALGGRPLMDLAAEAQTQGRLLVEPPTPPAMAAWAPGDVAWAPYAAALASFARPLTGTSSSRLPVLAACALAWGLVAWAWAQQLGRTRFTPWPLARACRRCNAVTCARCPAGAEDVGLCGPCQQAALGADAQGIALRPVQEAAQERAYARRRRHLRLGAWLCPGLGLILSGRPIYGVVVALAWAQMLYMAPWSWLQLPDPLPFWAQAPAQVGGAPVVWGTSLVLGAGIWLVGLQGGDSHAA